jgi:pimeloyl-ACP methyl ester carboxylesterase
MRSDAADAMAHMHVPVLLMHGTDDWIVPFWNSLLLRQKSAAVCELVQFRSGGHQSLWMDCDSELADRAIGWFDRRLEPTGRGRGGNANSGMLDSKPEISDLISQESD